MKAEQQTPALDQGERDKLKQLGRAVVETEAAAVAALSARMDDNFVRACELMLACEGRIVVIGMGKSGHIGSKIAATLASTGSPAFFVHPGEASHGDLGMITTKDVVVAFSNSGETEEILTIMPLIKRLAVPLIALTGSETSSLGKGADVHLDISVAQEACPLGLAPTSSTTVSLVMGDALAVAMLEQRGFTAEDFARSHPGGRLGRRLLLLIRDIMHSGDALPRVSDDVQLVDALMEMSRKGLGMTAVVDQQDKLVGVFTDGDLRRAVDQGVDIYHSKVGDLMTSNSRTVGPDDLAVEALLLMETHKINALLVVDQNNVLVGALNMHDLLRAGVV